MLTSAGELIDEFSVPCPDCRAPAGTQCINSITKLPLRRATAHPGRIRDATPTREEQEG